MYWVYFVDDVQVRCSEEGVWYVGVSWVHVLLVVGQIVGVCFACCVCCCVVFGMVIGVVLVLVMTLLLLGASIVEPRLIHYYDVGVVCAMCVLESCVSCSRVLRVFGVWFVCCVC